MNQEPKLRLYSEAHCVGDRPDISAIRGERVGIIARSLDDNGDWNYTVSKNETSETFVCSEAELVPASPVPLVPDEEIVANVVAQTADLRFSVKSNGLRHLLRERGIDALKCLQISCDQGDDVRITLVLPDGTVVNADYREHHETRQAIRFEEWKIQTYSDRELDLCREILAGDTSAFDGDVLRYFEEHLEATDASLPPLKWGDRIWHHFEQPPRRPT